MTEPPDTLTRVELMEHFRGQFPELSHSEREECLSDSILRWSRKGMVTLHEDEDGELYVTQTPKAKQARLEGRHDW